MVKFTDQGMGPSVEDASKGDSVDRAGGELFEGEEAQNLDEPDWLSIARDSYEDSTRFIESSLRWQWERNERAFQSRHPAGSKYESEQYKFRSRLYRPKTRTMIRQGEAAVAASFFASEDVVVVNPIDPSEQMQRASGEISKELLQYRLTTPDHNVAIPWFMTCVGGYQDAQKYGFVTSKQYWEYEERVETRNVPDKDDEGNQRFDESGNPMYREIQETKVIKDKPCIDLIAPENVRIDRATDWRDPINKSPFCIILHPMYIHECEARMEVGNPKTGEKAWRHLDRAELKKAGNRQTWDSTRSQREGTREDSKESEIAVDEYFIVWIHENFVRWDGIDYCYYTAGTHALLSDPIRTSEIYLHCAEGVRPVRMGYAVLETNKIYPSSKPQLTEGLQMMANEIANQRIDNVRLAMNKRYLVKRGKQVDLRSLTRSSPGAITLVTDIEKDVKEIDTRDVTASAYEEQNRINIDFDEIAGSFGAGTVQSNRSLNETVGGMQMLAGAATSLAELDLRVFTETWVEPVLRDVLKMEQVYETDEKIIAMSAKKAQLFQTFGISEITDALLEQNLMLKVNVGLGATDPMQRLNKFSTAAKITGEIFGEKIVPFLDMEEIVKEIFAPLGYRDGSRFFKFGDQDPMVQMLMQEIQALTQELESDHAELASKEKIAEIGAMGRLLVQRIENEGSLQKTQMQTKSNMSMERLKQIGQSFLQSDTADANLQLEGLRGGQSMMSEIVRNRMNGGQRPNS